MRLVRITSRDRIARALRIYGDQVGAARAAALPVDSPDWYTDRTILFGGTPVTYAPCGCVFDWTPGKVPTVGRTFVGCNNDGLDHVPLAGVAGSEMNEHDEDDEIQTVTVELPGPEAA